ncbi:MAG: hypothetical protein DRI84_07855, partial [Bacteroidetes bacterium]
TVLDNGKMNGLMLIYYKKGSVRVSGMYQKNLKHGKWLLYDEQGSTIQEEEYQNGRLINKVVYQEDKSPDKEIKEDTKSTLENRENSNSENGPGETPFQ